MAITRVFKTRTGGSIAIAQPNGTNAIKVDDKGIGYFNHATAAQMDAIPATAIAADASAVCAVVNSLLFNLKANGMMAT